MVGRRGSVLQKWRRKRKGGGKKKERRSERAKYTLASLFRACTPPALSGSRVAHLNEMTESASGPLKRRVHHPATGSLTPSLFIAVATIAR